MLLEAAARITGDSYFGLHFGERTNPKNVGPLIYVTLNSPNIATSLENAGRYFKIHNETAHLSLMIEGDRAVICQHWLILGSVRYGSGVRYPPNDGRKPVSTRQVYFARETPDQIFGTPSDLRRAKSVSPTLQTLAVIILRLKSLERATGIEPVTSSLGSWHSTAELRPPK